MTDRTQVHGLQVATELYNFVNTQVLPGTGVDQDTYWKGFDAIVADLAPKNAALLAERDRLQTSSIPGTRPTPAPSPTWWPTASF
jgi:malate synthase